MFNFSCHKTPIHLLLFVAVNLHKKTNKNAIWFIVFFNIQYAVIDARLNMETCMNIQQGFLPQVCATVTSAEMVTCFSFKFNPEHQFNHRWPLRKRSCNLLVVSPPANSLQCDLRRTYRENKPRLQQEGKQRKRFSDVPTRSRGSIKEKAGWLKVSMKNTPPPR